MKSEMILIIKRVVFLFSLLSASLFADKGSISFIANVKIFEPNQRALIGWNGSEEILLLSTDLHASEKTKVLEVLPLPSEPKITKGDIEVFRKATKLINDRIRLNARHGISKGGGGTRSVQPQIKPAEITFHEKIGAHDLAVAHVLEEKGFISWVEDYLKKANVENPIIPEELKNVISDYLQDGFSWFAFDVIELDTIPKTNDAIQYRFSSNYLYYPLRITKAESGYTNVSLIILTPRYLITQKDKSYTNIRLPHKPITISLNELKWLSPDIAQLLGNPEYMKLRIWKVGGDLKSFDKDIMAMYRKIPSTTKILKEDQLKH